MARGRLEPPNLDDRTWQDLVDQARALIPTYAPTWTDHNPSDLGITLIELFAWMVEGMTYRLNRVPDKHLVEFLNLIGITRDPATPASTFMRYQLADGADPLTLPKGHQVATAQTEETDAIAFETDETWNLLPSNLSHVLCLQAPEDTPERIHYRDLTSQVVTAPVAPLTLNLGGQGLAMLVLGFDVPSAELIRLRLRFRETVEADAARITWHHSRGDAPPLSEAEADWSDLRVTSFNDGTDGFKRNGVVSFSIPAPWDAQNPADWGIPPAPGVEPLEEERFWVGALIRNLGGQTLSFTIEHLLFNAVPATNALTVAGPIALGASKGEPFQFFELPQQPVYKELKAEDPYSHLTIEVRQPLLGGGFGPWQEWSRVEDFPAGPGQSFRLQPVTGEIELGNHEPTTSPDGHGSIPPLGSEIRALGYRHVAGDATGNVPAGTVNVARTALPGLIAVENPIAASGGSNEESVDDTKRRAPQVLRTRERAITVDDYEYLAREATTDVRKTRCLPERLFREFDRPLRNHRIGDPWTFGGLNRDRGNVNVIVVPDAALTDRTPLPSEELLQEVSDHLQARRVLGTTLHVTYPRYLPIDVTVNVSIWNEALQTGFVASVDQVVQNLRSKITRFLHPLYGAPDGTGWEVGQVFLVSGLLEFVQPSTDLGFISSLSVAAATPLYEPPERPGVGESDVWVQLADYELVCSGTHTIRTTVL